jgi:hypothetical protein
MEQQSHGRSAQYCVEEPQQDRDQSFLGADPASGGRFRRPAVPVGVQSASGPARVAHLEGVPESEKRSGGAGHLPNVQGNMPWLAYASGSALTSPPSPTYVQTPVRLWVLRSPVPVQQRRPTANNISPSAYSTPCPPPCRVSTLGGDGMFSNGQSRTNASLTE